MVRVRVPIFLGRGPPDPLLTGGRGRGMGWLGRGVKGREVKGTGRGGEGRVGEGRRIVD